MPQVADQEPPATLPVVVTIVPVGMLTSEVADVAGADRSRAVQLGGVARAGGRGGGPRREGDDRQRQREGDGAREPGPTGADASPPLGVSGWRRTAAGAGPSELRAGHGAVTADVSGARHSPSASTKLLASYRASPGAGQ